MPSLETLPAELHLEILSLLSAPNSPAPYAVIPFARTSRTLYSITYAHCSALISRIFADNSILRTLNPPPITAIVRERLHICLFCGTARTFGYRVFYPGIRRCKECSKKLIPTLTLTNALKTYRLTRHRFALEGELKCESMMGPWGMMSIYLTADVEAFAERIHGMPIADLFALKKQRINKLNAAREALHAAKEKALDECLELNNVRDVPPLRKKLLINLVEGLSATGGMRAMTTPTAVQKAVREEILRRKMRGAGYEEYWKDLLDTGKYVLRPHPHYSSASEMAKDPYPRDWWEPKLEITNGGSQEGERTYWIPTRGFLGKMFFREFGGEGAENGRLQQRMCDEPQEENISLWCQQSFRDNFDGWGSDDEEPGVREAGIGGDAFCASWSMWRDRLTWVPWSWGLYPVLVLEPFWIPPELIAKRTEKYKKKEERLWELKNQKIKEEWEKLSSHYRRAVRVITHDDGDDASKKILMARLGIEAEGPPHAGDGKGKMNRAGKA